MSHNSITQSFLNVVLIFIESAMTLALRLDPKLRQAAYPLAQEGIVVRIRTYLPHVEFYATFTPRGVLLDSTLPTKVSEADVIVNAYTVQLLKVLVVHDTKQVSKLPMLGNQALVEQVRIFILQLGIGSLIQGVIKSFQDKKSTDSKKEDKTNESIALYKQRLKEQQAQLNILTVKNRELEMTQKELESKQKYMFIAIIILAILLVLAVIGWLN